MKILKFSDIIELNKIMQQDELAYKIHLNDACGGQSFRIETLAGDEISENFYKKLEGFFSEKGMNIKYNSTKTEFWSV